MGSGWIRIFVLVAVAALLANVQCYGTCSTAAIDPTHAPSTNSCHHEKSSHEDLAPCPHQHSDCSGPEIRTASVSVAAATLILPMLQAGSSAVVIEPQFVSQLDTGSPPGASHFRPTVSVLRI
jgi:hypothetical protein